VQAQEQVTRPRRSRNRRHQPVLAQEQVLGSEHHRKSQTHWLRTLLVQERDLGPARTRSRIRAARTAVLALVPQPVHVQGPGLGLAVVDGYFACVMKTSSTTFD